MGLKRTFNRAGRTLAAALACLSLGMLAGCGPAPEQLGTGAAKAGLQGTTVSEQVFQGGPQMPHATVDAAALQTGHKYVFDGALSIRGNLPAGTIVEVTHGRLDISGNVGNESRLDVEMPVVSHDEDSIIPVMTSCGKGCMTTIMMPVTNTVIDGLKYPGDHTPAVTVHGTIGDNVTITTNGGVHAGGWGMHFNVKADYGADTQQVKPVQIAPALAARVPGMGPS
jgi:hypothetical protein